MLDAATAMATIGVMTTPSSTRAPIARRRASGGSLRSVPAVGLLAVLVAALVPAGPAAAATRWQPSPSERWQVQLSGRPDPSVAADVYEFEPDDAGGTIVARVHAAGGHAVCYISAGTWEDWRRDAGAFPRSVIGLADVGWPGERWLDIRRIDVLGPILRARVARCARAGYDGVDFDNVDGFRAPTGFPLTWPDQLRFDRWLAAMAHAAGLAVMLKNDLDQARILEPDFDGSVLEECVRYRECDRIRPFVAAGKKVVDLEYTGTLARDCAATTRLGIEMLRKRVLLGRWLARCR
jgi:hypothetical protein